MSTSKIASRAGELRAALSQAESDLAAARERLGTAIADGADSTAVDARAEVAQLERLHAELASALPIAERRAREAVEAEHQARRRTAEREANKNRKARIAAARKVDAALRTLGRAYDEYIATAPGGKPEDAARLARRSRHAVAAATFAAAPGFANAIEPHRRPPRMHWQALANAVEGTVGEFDVEDVEP